MLTLRSQSGDPYALSAAVLMFIPSKAKYCYSLPGRLVGLAQMRGAECIGNLSRHQAVARVEGDVIGS